MLCFAGVSRLSPCRRVNDSFDAIANYNTNFNFKSPISYSSFVPSGKIGCLFGAFNFSATPVFMLIHDGLTTDYIPYRAYFTRHMSPGSIGTTLRGEGAVKIESLQHTRCLNVRDTKWRESLARQNNEH